MQDTAQQGRLLTEARPAAGGDASSSLGRIPDFFIVGHPKCGTTALFDTLRRHPQIHMPAKEPRFFAIEEIDMGTHVCEGEGERESIGSPASEPRARGERQAQGKRPRTLDGYAALFAGARPGQRVGEATPAYLRSPLAAGRIASVRPDARIIAIIREPVSFLRSFHLQALRGYNETQRDFRKALALEDARRAGRRVPRLSRTPRDLLYSDHVRYVEQLRRYHAVFAPEQVLVLIYEDFKADNDAVMRTVLRFLEVDDTAPIEATQTRPSHDVRFQPLHTLVNLRRIALRNLAFADALSRTVNTLTPTRLRGAVRTNWRRVAFSEPLPLDDRLMRELRGRFKGEVEALSDYLGRDLVTLWGYDDAG
jgi:Sulfotransferase family